MKNKLIFNIKLFLLFIFIKIIIIIFIGDWGLGIGDWGLGPIPNPHNKKLIYFFIIKFY